MLYNNDFRTIDVKKLSIYIDVYISMYTTIFSNEKFKSFLMRFYSFIMDVACFFVYFDDERLAF